MPRLPRMQGELKSDYERIKRRVKVWLWLFNFFLLGLIGVGAIALLVKLAELVLLKLGIID